jgi:hypothetical protein
VAAQDDATAGLSAAELPERDNSDISREARSTWARLIRKIFETDPLLCACGGRMRIVSFITDPRVVDRHPAPFVSFSLATHPENRSGRDWTETRSAECSIFPVQSLPDLFSGCTFYHFSTFLANFSRFSLAPQDRNAYKGFCSRRALRLAYLLCDIRQSRLEEGVGLHRRQAKN